MIWRRRIPSNHRFRALARILFSAVLAGAAAAPALAETGGENLRLATDSASTHLFLLNPAIHKPSGTRVAGIVTQDRREASLDHQGQGNDKVTAKTTDESLGAAALVDLGAGAGLGLSHQVGYRKTQTELASDGPRQPTREELEKTQQSVVRLIIELTEEIKAGIAIRYLYKDRSILGDPFLNQNEVTQYKTTLVGYGSGFAYLAKSGGVSYTYYPPLRGKTEIYGEEMIVIERGLISLDGFVMANGAWTLGILGQRWLNDVDDLAGGTTAADNETNISLYGLDPDQYVIPKQLILAGIDYQVNPTLQVRVSAGQEQATLNFNDLRVFNRASVNGRGEEPVIKYNRARAALHFALKGNVSADLGLGTYQRSFDFPDAMNGGTYKGSGRELYATLGLGI